MNLEALGRTYHGGAPTIEGKGVVDHDNFAHAVMALGKRRLEPPRPPVVIGLRAGETVTHKALDVRNGGKFPRGSVVLACRPDEIPTKWDGGGSGETVDGDLFRGEWGMRRVTCPGCLREGRPGGEVVNSGVIYISAGQVSAIFCGGRAWRATGVDAGQTVFEASFVEEEDAHGAADAFERRIADAVRDVARGMGETNPPVFWLTAHPYNDQIPTNTLVRAEVL